MLKRKRITGIVLLLMLLAAMSIGWTWRQSTAAGLISISQGDEVWVVTDLHYLSPKLQDNGKAFQIMQNTAAGKDLLYGKERLEALLFQIKKEQPKALIVSGDLTFNGEHQSLVEMADYFHRMEQAGTQVLVIPGNHDISSGWAREFRGDKQYRTKQISPEDFETQMADFGYKDADARDEASLSYLMKSQDKLWFLMLDSNIYTVEEGKDAPKTNGRLKAETLTFVEEQLKAAQQEGVQVIPVMHHNVLDQHTGTTNGFTLDNAADLRALYKKYHQKIAFSGHIHTQNIATWNMGDGQELTEIVNGAFSIYPATIGRLTFQNQEVHYRQTSLDTDSWAKQAQLTSSDVTHHQDYLKSVFNKSSQIMVHTMMHDEGWYDGDTADEIAKMVEPLNLSFFSGEHLSQDWLAKNVYQQPTYQMLDKTGKKSFLKGYLDEIIAERDKQSVQEVTVDLQTEAIGK